MNDKEKLTFSNTQNWDKRLVKILKSLNDTHKKYIKLLNINYKNFNKNNSKKTLDEINDLINLQKNRSVDDIKNIKNEINAEYSMIYRFNMSVDEIYILDPFMRNILLPIILYIKYINNRVRPSYLTKKIKPCIETPGHPSYPSGHSIEVYMIANILSDKYPNKKEDLFRIADKIAKNRELAGVHYRSDTQFGKYLAKKLYILFKKDGYFDNI
jgi:acid phosphatase (class A)